MSSYKKDKDFLCNKLNEYGVLNTFSLITKIYADSTIMNSNDFNNINVSLLENNNYDYFKFEITGQSNKKINGFGRFPFAALIQGWSGYDLNANDNVKVVFEYMRSPTSTMNGTNKFDLSDINFGDNLGGASTITWKKLNVDLDLPYMRDFSGICKIYVNNQLIKTSDGNDNRVHFAFIYNHKNEYD